VAGMIAVSYGLTYIWGTVGIALICKYLPRWWGVEIKAEAKKFEEQLGVANVDDAGITGWRPLAVRAYRLTNDTLTGWTVQQFTRKYPHYKVLNVLRVEPVRRAHVAASAPGVVEDEAIMLAAAGGASTTRLHESGPAIPHAQRGVLPQTIYTKLGTSDELALRQGDIVTLGGRPEQLGANLALIGPEVADPSALNVPLDRAEIVVTNRTLEGKELVELRNEDFVGEVAVHHIERRGVPMPMGLHTTIERFDVFFVAGMKSGVDRLARMLGSVARPSTSTDLVTLSAGMILGLAIGSMSFPLAGASVGLGNTGGLLISGVLVSSAASRLRFFGNTPSAARNMLEDLGLVAFVAIVAINAGASAVTQVSADLVMKIMAAGFVTCALPPILAWAIGLHVMKINAAVLVGAVGGARSHAGPAREASRETASSVAWTGFPIAHAVSGILLTLFGYVAMILSKL
jgi:putative transport protein